MPLPRCRPPMASPIPGSRRPPSNRAPWRLDVIGARLAGKPAPAPFRYRHQGNLATIGKSAAVVDFGWLQLRGWLAQVVSGASPTSSVGSVRAAASPVALELVPDLHLRPRLLPGDHEEPEPHVLPAHRQAAWQDRKKTQMLPDTCEQSSTSQPSGWKLRL